MIVEHDLVQALRAIPDEERGWQAKKTQVKCQSCQAISVFDPERVSQRCDFCGSTDFVRRPDDRPEAVQKRFQVYRDQTAPILPYYRNKGVLDTVDGMGEMDAVTRQIEAIIGR